MTEFDQNQENNQSMEDAMKSVQEVKVGDVVKGEVLVIEDKQVIVGIEGLELKESFRQRIINFAGRRYQRSSKVGDVLDLVVISTIGKDKENGSYLLSKRRLDAKKFGKISKEISKRARSSKHLLQMLSKAV